ncbi:MAG: STAS domain-containing protein [Planctomycetota bacterium]
MRIEPRAAGNVTILACAGAIDADSVRVLGEKTDAVVETGCRRLVLSLGEVEFYDSTLVARLATASQRLEDVKGEMVISASLATLQLLRTLGIAKKLKVFTNDRAALSYFDEAGDGLGARLEPPRPSGSPGAWPEEHPRPRP